MESNRHHSEASWSADLDGLDTSALGPNVPVGEVEDTLVRAPMSDEVRRNLHAAVNDRYGRAEPTQNEQSQTETPAEKASAEPVEPVTEDIDKEVLYMRVGHRQQSNVVEVVVRGEPGTVHSALSRWEELIQGSQPSLPASEPIIDSSPSTISMKARDLLDAKPSEVVVPDYLFRNDKVAPNLVAGEVDQPETAPIDITEMFEAEVVQPTKILDATVEQKRPTKRRVGRKLGVWALSLSMSAGGAYLAYRHGEDYGQNMRATVQCEVSKKIPLGLGEKYIPRAKESCELVEAEG